VSPLWRDEVGAYLSPHRLCLVRMRRGARPKAIASHEQKFEDVKNDSWEAPLGAFTTLLAQSPWSGARTRVVLADHWARYIIVPFSAEISSEQDRIGHARQLLNSAYGEGVAAWDVCISNAPPTATRVGCAVPAELIAGIRTACAAARATLVSLQPQLIDAYAVWRHTLPPANSWFVSVEQGSLTAARLARNGWDRVYGVRIGSDWLRELRRLQTFGRLARSHPEDGQVYVDAPHSWRTVAVGAADSAEISGLQWLDESKAPLTTLQQLAQARRMVA
jgi:hypothetical protein